VGRVLVLPVLLLLLLLLLTLQVVIHTPPVLLLAECLPVLLREGWGVERGDRRGEGVGGGGGVREEGR
jgi:hypothetical protein